MIGRIPCASGIERLVVVASLTTMYLRCRVNAISNRCSPQWVRTEPMRSSSSIASRAAVAAPSTSPSAMRISASDVRFNNRFIG